MRMLESGHEAGASAPKPLFSVLAGVAGIEIRRCLLLPLRGHLCRIRLAEDAARAKLFPLLVILGLARAAVIDLRAPPPVLFIDLPAVLEFLRRGRILLIGHRVILRPSVFASRNQSETAAEVSSVAIDARPFHASNNGAST